MEQSLRFYLNDHLYIDLHDEAIVKNGLRIALSRIQFRILDCLLAQSGRPVSYKDIICHTWNTYGLDERQELYVYINRLRMRIEDDPKNPRYLLSIHGYGYILYSYHTDAAK